MSHSLKKYLKEPLFLIPGNIDLIMNALQQQEIYLTETTNLDSFGLYLFLYLLITDLLLYSVILTLVTINL